MNVSYTIPLTRAWARMRGALFRPFRLESWLVFGLSAFLSQFASGTFSGGGIRWPGRTPTTPEGGEEAVRTAAARFLEHPLWLLAIAAGLIVLAALIVLFLWVGARAQFVFLHDVATGRPEFREPWRRFRSLGHSLFLWMAGFSFVWLVPLAIVVLALAGTIAGAIHGDPLRWPALAVLLPAGALVFACLLVIALVNVLVEDFVVPVMFLHGERVTQAWARFRPLLFAHFGEFVAYALFKLVLELALALALVLVGLATCCVGLIVMATPYIGSVATLPFAFTGRALGPEFLAQFGPDWDALAAGPPPAPASAPGSAPAGA